MKKSTSLVFVFLFLIIFLNVFLIGVVRAQSFDEVRRAVSDAATPILSFALGNVSEELLFIKFLVFILLIVIIRFALIRMPGFEDKWTLAGVISVIVSLIAVRYITTDALVSFIWLPYGILGVALSTFLPLLIFFFFIESINSRAMRVIGWAAFIVIYIGLAIMRWDDFARGESFNLAWFYVFIAVISGIILIFERSIRIRVMLGMIRRGEDTHSLVLKSELQEELRKINTVLANPALSRANAARLQQEKRRIEEAIARIR